MRTSLVSLVSLVSFLCLLGLAAPASAGTLQVGPGRTLTVPSQAAAVANDGDLIEIDAGEYLGDVATWTQDNLILRGVSGRASLRANGNNAGGKGIWVIKGANTTVENIEFSEATVPDGNGAGIRQEGAGLTVRDCSFHDNENGILAGANATSDILIERTEFARNGSGDGRTHNMYIGAVSSFTLRFSYSHNAVVGHNVKSRALENYILYNRISEEGSATTSDAIDLPNGGRSYIIGNMIHQGDTANGNIIRYGEEGLSNPIKDLYVVNNTIVSDRGTGVFLKIAAGATPAVVKNNIFLGNGTTISGPADASNNYEGADPKLADRAGFDFRLLTGSPCIDAGVAPGSGGGFELLPVSHYVHPLGSSARPGVGTVDIGAYEFGVPPGAPDAGPPNQTDAGGGGDGGFVEGDAGNPADGDGGGGCCSATPLRSENALGMGLLILLLGACLRRSAA